MLWTVVSFSVLTLLCAFAPNPRLFGVLRFLAGLGLGGVLPTSTRRRRAARRWARPAGSAGWGPPPGR
jgi:MFS family permease